MDRDSRWSFVRGRTPVPACEPGTARAFPASWRSPASSLGSSGGKIGSDRPSGSRPLRFPSHRRESPTGRPLTVHFRRLTPCELAHRTVPVEGVSKYYRFSRAATFVGRGYEPQSTRSGCGHRQGTPRFFEPVDGQQFRSPPQLLDSSTARNGQYSRRSLARAVVSSGRSLCPDRHGIGVTLGEISRLLRLDRLLRHLTVRHRRSTATT